MKCKEYVLLGVSYINFTQFGELSCYKFVKQLKVHGLSSLSAFGQEQIEVYGTLGCKFCRISKAKLQELGLTDFTTILLDDPPDDVDTERLHLARSSTVPQIYVGSDHVGG